MTSRELRQLCSRYQHFANDCAKWVCLNPQNAAHWRAEAAKFRALANAAKVELDIQQWTKARA